MTKIVTINHENFIVDEDEYKQIPHEEFNNLIILDNLGVQERLTGLLRDLTDIENNMSLKCINATHGGYIPIKCSPYYKKINITTTESQEKNIKENVETFKINNINFDFSETECDVLFINNILINLEFITLPKFILCLKEMKLENENYISFDLSDSLLTLYVLKEYEYKFLKEFHYYIEDNILKYDNLIHLAMIVKNAGDVFEDVLKQNYHLIDRWTILDTGSTDNTIDIINRVLVGKKKGELYEEPFINFRDSRNR